MLLQEILDEEDKSSSSRSSVSSPVFLEYRRECFGTSESFVVIHRDIDPERTKSRERREAKNGDGRIEYRVSSVGRHEGGVLEEVEDRRENSRRCRIDIVSLREIDDNVDIPARRRRKGSQFRFNSELQLGSDSRNRQKESRFETPLNFDDDLRKHRLK